MIRRGKHESRYSIIPNDTSDDMSLTYEALGLLVYLIAKPQDWRVRIPDLTKRKGTGRDRCYKLLAELEAAGYIVRERIRRKGKMGEIEYVVYDTPRTGVSATPDLPDDAPPHPENQEVGKKPRPEKPDTENPDTENQDTYKGPTSTNSGKGQRTEGASATQPDLLGESEVPESKRRRKKPHVPLPDGKPDAEDLTYARVYWRENGFPQLDPEREALRFRNHHAARGSMMADWSAAWRTWVMNAVKFAAKDAPQAGKPSAPGSSPDVWHTRVRGFFEKNIWVLGWGPKPGEPGCEAPQKVVEEERARSRSAA